MEVIMCKIKDCKTIFLIIFFIFSVHAPGYADDWCTYVKERYPTIDHETCPAWAKEDDAVCAKGERSSYDGCRLGLMIRHGNTTTPPGTLRIINCQLPDSSIISTVDQTCVTYLGGKIIGR
jgi:hypothetical protein